MVFGPKVFEMTFKLYDSILTELPYRCLLSFNSYDGWGKTISDP